MTEQEKPTIKDVARELKKIGAQKIALWECSASVSPEPLLTTYGAMREIVRLGKREAELLRINSRGEL